MIGFWTIDEPAEPESPIKEQRRRYLAVKAVTNKRVFVVRADFADVSYRGLYAPDVQDVVVLDLYPYRSDMNPRANVDVGKLLTFSRVSELFINRTTDLDKARLSRYIPVFQGFFDVREDTWLKGDTYASSLFFNRLAGQPRSHGSFIWNYPSAAVPYLMGLGQEARGSAGGGAEGRVRAIRDRAGRGRARRCGFPVLHRPRSGRLRAARALHDLGGGAEQRQRPLRGVRRSSWATRRSSTSCSRRATAARSAGSTPRSRR